MELAVLGISNDLRFPKHYQTVSAFLQFWVRKKTIKLRFCSQKLVGLFAHEITRHPLTLPISSRFQTLTFSDLGHYWERVRQHTMPPPLPWMGRILNPNVLNCVFSPEGSLFSINLEQGSKSIGGKLRAYSTWSFPRLVLF